MQQLSPSDSAARPVVAPDSIELAVRSSCGDGSRVFVVKAPACSTIADLKQQLCCSPHSLHSDAMAFVLVLKGTNIAVFYSFDPHLTLQFFLFNKLAGVILDDSALCPAEMTEGLLFTAVLLAPSSVRAPMQLQSTTATCKSPAETAVCVAAATATHVVKHRESGPSPSLSTSATAESDDKPGPSLFFPAQAAAPDAATVHNGSRVRIEGLQAAQHMNGRTGTVCGVYDQEGGRWTVDVAAEGELPAIRGSFRAANLRLIPSHNFSTEWVDEGGHVWPKNVDFSRQCAKGHALAPVGERAGLIGTRLMCRLCHCFCGRNCDDAANWLTCMVDAGCCGEYAVCCSCAHSPSTAAATCEDTDDFHMLVS
jgi:hypothetical protein